MCIVALAHRVLGDAPVALAANREEAYARQGTEPFAWAEPDIAAGQDPVAGGTWLGVGRRGLVAAITNRGLASGRKSRGALCLDLLRAETAAAAIAVADSLLASGDYGECNALVADGRDAFVAHSGAGPVRCVELPPGIHLLARGDVDDAADDRQALAARRLAAEEPASAAGWLSALPPILGLHAAGGEPPMCLHHGSGGTVSADVIAIRPGGTGTWLHAQGPPCRTGFTDHSATLLEILGRGGGTGSG